MKIYGLLDRLLDLRADLGLDVVLEAIRLFKYTSTECSHEVITWPKPIRCQCNHFEHQGAQNRVYVVTFETIEHKIGINLFRPQYVYVKIPGKWFITVYDNKHAYISVLAMTSMVVVVNKYSSVITSYHRVVPRLLHGPGRVVLWLSMGYRV